MTSLKKQKKDEKKRKLASYRRIEAYKEYLPIAFLVLSFSVALGSRKLYLFFWSLTDPSKLTTNGFCLELTGIAGVVFHVSEVIAIGGVTLFVGMSINSVIAKYLIPADSSHGRMLRNRVFGGIGIGFLIYVLVVAFICLF